LDGIPAAQCFFAGFGIEKKHKRAKLSAHFTCFSRSDAEIFSANASLVRHHPGTCILIPCRKMAIATENDHWKTGLALAIGQGELCLLSNSKWEENDESQSISEKNVQQLPHCEARGCSPCHLQEQAPQAAPGLMRAFQIRAKPNRTN